MSLPLSKCLDPADYDQLQPELAIVDQHFTAAREQHPARRWEYALALRAYDQWYTTPRAASGPIYDVGGAGSPFFRMLDPGRVTVIDPDEPDGCDLASFVRGGAPLAHAVFCLSVLEHVEDLDQFLYHLGCLVAPGGLLFLTMDCREDDPTTAGLWPTPCPVDDRHFSHMRRRIFTPRVVEGFGPFHLFNLGFGYFGGVDLTYRVHQLYGSYSFASLVLQKKP